jgi:hypothetical protein
MQTIAIHGRRPGAARAAQAGHPVAVTTGGFIAVLLLVALAFLFAPRLVAHASAADRGTVFQVGSSVNIPSSDSASSVFVIGGDVTVGGTVRNALVDVGGNVRLLPTAVIGPAGNASGGSLVLVGGSLSRAPGAVVHGKTTTVSGSWAGDIWRTGVVDPIVRPFRASSLIGWAGSTVLYGLVAIVIAALAPHQMAAIGRRIRQRFWPTFGWGLLAAIVIVPVVTVLLIVSIIGILALLPWALVVFAAYLFGAVGAAVLVGEVILPALTYRRENLILAAVIGVLVVRLVGLIPVAGSIAVGLLWIVGFGAVCAAFWSWARTRRQPPVQADEERREQQPPPAVAA